MYVAFDFSALPKTISGLHDVHIRFQCLAYVICVHPNFRSRSRAVSPNSRLMAGPGGPTQQLGQAGRSIGITRVNISCPRHVLVCLLCRLE